MSNVISLYDDARPCDTEQSDMGVIGARADYDRRDYMFARSIREGRHPHLELVQTKPIEPLWKTFAAAALFSIFLGALIGFLP